MIGYIFGASFKQFSLSFPDVNKNKGVAETAPLIPVIEWFHWATLYYRRISRPDELG